jgi:hypothetical protein
VTLGLDVNFDDYIDYSKVYEDPKIPQRQSYLNSKYKRELQKKDDEHYIFIGDFFNK